MSAVTLEGVLSRLSPAERERLARIQKPPVRARIEALTKPAVRASSTEPRRVALDDLSILAAARPGGAYAHIKGLRLAYTLNSREHWSAKAREVEHQRAAVRLAFEGVALPTKPTRVLIVREGPVLLDTDNAVAACKAVRDEIAALLGVDDGPKGPVTWVVEQLRERAYGVRIEITGGG